MARVLPVLRGSVALAIGAFASALYAAPSDDVKALLEQGKAAEAYAEGKRHPNHLGDPAFDFFFGIAAIDAGRAGEGVLALERYLLNFPDNQSARFHAARGYFQLGDDAQARAEFESLRKLNPPADMVAEIDRYLDAIRLRETRYSFSSGTFVELGIGRDTNVNAGPASSDIFVPGFGMQPLNESSQKTAATFASLAAGGFLRHPVKPGVALFADIQAAQNFNFNSDTEQFDLGNYNALGGVVIVRDVNQFRLGVNYGVVTVGGSVYRSTVSGLADWQIQLDARQSITFGAQAARLAYDDQNSPRDADFYGGYFSYYITFDHAWQPALTVGINSGKQRSRTDHSELVPDTFGLSANFSFSPAEKWGMQLGYTFQISDYGGPDFYAYPDARHDRFQAGTVALTYLVSRNISIRADALFSKNRSNADAYEFPRDVYSVKVRYEFK